MRRGKKFKGLNTSTKNSFNSLFQNQLCDIIMQNEENRNKSFKSVCVCLLCVYVFVCVRVDELYVSGNERA